MTSTTITLGPVPPEESCAQLGRTPDFDRLARLECAVYRAAMIAMFGPPPDGATLHTASHRHDFGTYYEVEIHYDTDDETAARYATQLELDGPSRWSDAGFSGPLIYGERGTVLGTAFPTLTAAIGMAVRTLGQFADGTPQAAMLANLCTAFPAEVADAG